MKLLIYISLFFVFFNHIAAAPDSKEHVTVLTDRSLYITREEIFFSALLSPGSESSILYCEIVTPKGYAVAGAKFNIENLACSGSLSIPSDLITGIYLFRAYTKVMRNQGPASFSYLQIGIINPYLNEVLGSITAADKNNPPGDLQNDDQEFVKIVPDKKLAGSGDSIQVSLYNISTEHSFRNISVAIIPDSLPQYPRILLPASLPEGENFMPENNGVSVTGRVRKNYDAESIKDIMVNLSILGKGHDFMATKTDSAGRFSFPLRGYSGYRDLFLSTGEDSTGQEIVLDTDFCTTPIDIPTSTFSLSGAERRAAYRMALNVQVDSLFRSKPVPDTTSVQDIADAFFYGTPDETIRIDNYVPLPTLEDYFNELPTLVKIRTSSGKKYFRILSDQAGLAGFNPLIMIDLVALNNTEKILALSPQDIDRIEVINSFYVKGAEIYGGIVNLISRHGDFAGIDLPASGLLVRYGFPVNNAVEITNSSGPDVRNTVLWIPHLTLTTESTFSFAAPSTPGRYVITVKGVTSEGSLFISSAHFDIRN